MLVDAKKYIKSNLSTARRHENKTWHALRKFCNDRIKSKSELAKYVYYKTD